MTGKWMVVCVIASVLLAGCATFQNLDSREEATAMVYRLTTWRLIDENVARGEFIETQTRRMMEDIDRGELITVAALRREVDHIVAKLGLTPMETMTLQDLIGLFSRDFSAQTETANQVQKIHEIIRPRLEWVHDAAVRMLEFLED